MTSSTLVRHVARQVGAALLSAVPLLVHAQVSSSPSSTSCNGQIIHEVRVTAMRPPFTGESAYWRRIARSVGLHHATTDTAVIRRFLALQAVHALVCKKCARTGLNPGSDRRACWTPTCG